jgi:hypothetical protein
VTRREQDDQAAHILAQGTTREKGGASPKRNESRPGIHPGRREPGPGVSVNDGGSGTGARTRRNSRTSGRHAGHDRQHPETIQEGEQGCLLDERPVQESEGSGPGGGGPHLGGQVGSGVLQPALVRRIVRGEVRHQAGW